MYEMIKYILFGSFFKSKKFIVVPLFLNYDNYTRLVSFKKTNFRKALF